MKTSELIGPALDWAVCVAEGNKPVINPVRFGGVSYGMFESELGYAIKRYCSPVCGSNLPQETLLMMAVETDAAKIGGYTDA